ncbi:MAG: hypothetical protein AB7O57_07675 [Hyphomicrobiaceae bacterium]
MTIRKRATGAGLALGLALSVHAPSTAVAQTSAVATTSGATSRQDYEACQSRDEVQFRTAIEDVTHRSLASSIRGLDYQPIVAEAWRKGNLDDVIARRVDGVLDELKKETSWGELISSLASRETQEKLAKAAAERTYGSDDMRRALETLAAGVGRSVGERLEMASEDAAEPTTRCLEAFLGPRYGSTVARVVAADAGKELSVDAAKGAAPVSRGSVLIETKEGLAGLVAVIMRRQLGNLSARVGQRLVGAVLGRVVSVVAGGIGVVLIAKDVWELRNGVLPIIASEMKAPATRDKVQAELAKSIASEIEVHLKDIARRTSERVIDIWHEFRRAHGKVLELAERVPAFKAFIDNVSPARLGRLDEVVALALAQGGEPRLLARVADGSLADAVERWPDGVMEIARDRRSLEAGYQWRALAGDQRIAKVLELELHRAADPETLTRQGLARIIEIDDRLAATRLAHLGRAALEPLLEMEAPSLKRLARAMGEVELQSLSGYLTALDKPAAKRLLASVAEVPARMQAIAPAHIREAILTSRDQAAALSMMLHASGPLDAGELVQDIERVRSGAVSWRLLVARYPIALAGLGAMGLALLLLLWRAIAGRRPGPDRTPAAH